MFKRNKEDAANRRIYEPEPDYSAEFPHSGWRKPLDVDEVNPRAKYGLLNFEKNLLKCLDAFNVILCLLIMMMLVKLVFFTTFERTVLVDGTELSCLVLGDGSVVPYMPPIAPSVPPVKYNRVQDAPLVASYYQSQAAVLGNPPPATNATSNSSVVVVPEPRISSNAANPLTPTTQAPNNTMRTPTTQSQAQPIGSMGAPSTTNINN